MSVFRHHSRRRALWLPACAAALAAAAALPATAAASTLRYPAGEGLPGARAAAAVNQTAAAKTLWLSDTLDRIANDVAGTTDMNVLVEDDALEWATFFPAELDSANVLGFVALNYAPLYHKILIGPFAYPIFGSWMSTGTPAGNEYGFGVAAMTLIHESFHWRLMSGDESTVNACALKYLPTYLETDFNVPPTVTETTTTDVPTTTTKQVPVTKVKVTKYRVKVRGKWVTKTRRTKTTSFVTKTETTYVSTPVTTTVPNPLFTTIVADASDFYARQPPPYNAGTCSV